MANNITLSYPSAFHHQFLDRNGKPLTGGKLYTYSAGTPTPIPTYKTIGDISSTNTNTNPIILDNAGMAYIVIETDKAYKFVLFDKDDAKIAEWDNVTGNIGGSGGSSEDIVVVGTPNEIDVSSSVTQGVKRYVISLSNSVKSTILYLVGLYNNVLNSLGNKADKVQGATAGNLAALDASGNLTDSGSKAADFKTKQTPVQDPSASGAGLEFIDSVSQNANGEITPHKKSVQDGTTAQKGVVQLQDSIGSTESSTDKAVTPHAVREAINSAVSSAYHAAGTKSVAQLTSSMLVAENEGCVYNVTDSGTTTSDFVDGAGHPINAGDNVGVCDVGGGVYKFDLLSGFVDLTNYLTKMGDASNTTSTFTKASGDTSSMASGSKLSAIFTAISSFFASVASALGGKADKVNSATNGNFASLDSNGNLTDSGKKAADFDKKRYSWDTNGIYRFFETPNTNVSNKWVKLAEVDASSITGNNRAIQFTGYVYNYGQNKRTYTKFVKVPFSAVFDITDDSQGVVVGNISGIDPLFGAPRVNDLIRIEKIDSKHWILELYTYSYQAYSLEIEASALFYSTLQPIVWASSDLTDTAPETGTIINSTLDDYDNCVNSIKASDYASGGGIDLALGGKLDTTGNASNATSTLTKASGDTSTMTSGGKLSAIFTAISSFFASLKALAFKDKVSDSDINGTISNSHIADLPASKITSGTFDEARIPTSLPDTGVGYLLPLVHFGASNITSSTQYALIAKKRYSGNDTRPGEMFRLFYNDVFIDFKTYGLIRPSAQTATLYVAPLQSFGMGEADWADRLHVTWTNDPSNQTIDVNIYFKFNEGENRFVTLYQYNGQAGGDRYNYTWTPYQGIESHYEAAAAGTEATYEWDRVYLFGSALYASKIGSYDSHPQIGSTTTPVYVDANGQVQPCDPSQMNVGSASKAFYAGYAPMQEYDNGSIYQYGTWTSGGQTYPIYHVHQLKNHAINRIEVKNLQQTNCTFIIEVPDIEEAGATLDFIVEFGWYSNNANIVCGLDVEGCKPVLLRDGGNYYSDAVFYANPQGFKQIVIVRGDTYEVRRVETT